jgi:hypothetical protein
VSALPLLVEWGNVISKLVVGGLAVGAVLGYRALRNHRDVKAARADAGRMSLSVDEPREGPIAVAGTYRAKGDERWLDCSGQRVVLVGELAIVRGSSATWKTGTRTYALRDGDGVVAIGVMSRRAGDNVTDYRESAGGWQLAASPGELGVQVCLVKPVPCPKPLWPIRGVLVLGVVGVAAYYGLGVVGKKLVESRKYPREAFLDGDGVSTLAAQIACALPRHRDMALDRYAIDLDYKPQTTEVIEQQIAIASLRGCWGGVRELEDRSRYEQGCRGRQRVRTSRVRSPGARRARSLRGGCKVHEGRRPRFLELHHRVDRCGALERGCGARRGREVPRRRGRTLLREVLEVPGNRCAAGAR